MENKIKAEIITHSKRKKTGEEIITYKLTFPRIILSEVNTYKMLEKNTSSCLLGNSLITLYDERRRKFFDLEIRRVFRDFVNDDIDYKIVSFVETGENAGSFILQDIKTVFASGVKEVYKIEQNNIYTPLTCTDKHRLFTDKGWKTLKDYFIEGAPVEEGECKYKFTDKLYALTTDVPYYDLKKEENTNTVVTKATNNKFKILNELEVISVKPAGKEETYDIEVEGEFHNFIANGVVVHNSRAIPFNKMVEVVEKEPFIPIAWQKPHSGMQGTEYYTDPKIIEHKIKNWLEARDSAVQMAEKMDIDTVEDRRLIMKDIRDIVEGGNYETFTREINNPISKQLKNRILETFMWTTQLVTGTKESFRHLFEQRCPRYEITEFNSKITGMSKKSLMEFLEGRDDIVNELKSKDDLWWLQHNKGQAEIHFMDLAEKMYDALMESKPFMIDEKMVESPDNKSDTLAWHIPFENEIIEQYKRENYGQEPTLDQVIVMSVARTARISYTKLNDLDNGNEHPDYWKSLKIYEKCKKEGHYSVFSHIGKCMADYEYDSWIKGKCKLVGFSEFDNETYLEAPSDTEKGWNKHLKGFISLRQYIEDEEDIKK